MSYNLINNTQKKRTQLCLHLKMLYSLDSVANITLKLYYKTIYSEIVLLPELVSISRSTSLKTPRF